MMNEHPQEQALSAYVDDALESAEADAVARHLDACAGCRAEAEALERLKERLAGAARRALPADIMAQWERRLAPAPWGAKWFSLLAAPRFWLPASAAAGAILFGLWWNLSREPQKEAIPLEALLVSHARYESEALVPHNDIFNSHFSAQLDNDNAAQN